MRDRCRVGFLSSRGHPLLPYFLDLVDKLTGIEPILILDDKEFAAKDLKIFQERTQGRLPSRDLGLFLKRYRWVSVPNHNGAECIRWVRSERVPLLVNAGTPRILQTDLLDAATIGVLNVHPGILPKYRGATCCEWAIYHDEPVGVTAHFMDAGLDSGPIIFTRTLHVKRRQTYSEVRLALYHLAHEARIEAIQEILHRKLTATNLPPQPESPLFTPIPDQLLEVVKSKLANGAYRHAE